MVKIIKKNRDRKNDNSNKNKDEQENKKKAPEEYVSPEFSKHFDENFKKFKAYLEDAEDVVYRKFLLPFHHIQCAVIFIDGLVSKDWVQRDIINPIILGIRQSRIKDPDEITKENAAEVLMNSIITAAEMKEAENLDKAMLPLMSGETILIVDGYDKVIVIGTRQWQARGVDEPASESIVRGPRDGFTETLRFNTALLRRRVRDPNLVMKNMTVGRRSKTSVVISYVKGIAQPSLVQEVEDKIKAIDTDDIFESGQIEQFLEGNKLSPFPQIQSTERPDKAVSSIMEGRVVVMVDGTPFVLIMPANLYQFFQSAEDYYERWIIGSLLRLLRWVGSFLSTFAPALYIAIVAYHPGMLPTALALSVAATRETVPFPAFVEAVLMETTIELLREAGARLPKAIGQTIGIVGGIIIGDAAVRAGIASPFMVIVVAITAISSFIIPSYNVAIAFRIIRFPIMVLAASLGLYGLMLAFILINIHMILLKSFGSNYMSPVAPVQIKDWKDVFVRFPQQWMNRRPEYVNPIDIDRGSQDPIKEG